MSQTGSVTAHPRQEPDEYAQPPVLPAANDLPAQRNGHGYPPEAVLARPARSAQANRGASSPSLPQKVELPASHWAEVGLDQPLAMPYDLFCRWGSVAWLEA